MRNNAHNPYNEAREAVRRMIREFFPVSDSSTRDEADPTEEERVDRLLALLQQIGPLLVGPHMLSQEVADAAPPSLDIQEKFKMNFSISVVDLDIIEGLLKGDPVNKIAWDVGISESWATKRIPNFWKRLGLTNRNQLIYVLGWMRLIPVHLDCLEEFDEK
jgi:hypothetical protein